MHVRCWMRRVIRALVAVGILSIPIAIVAEGSAGASATITIRPGMFQPFSQVSSITIPSSGPATVTFSDGRSLHVSDSTANQVETLKTQASTPSTSTSGPQPLNQSGSSGCATFWLWMWPNSNHSGADIYTGWRANTAVLGSLRSAQWFVHGYNLTYTRPFGFFLYGATYPPTSWSTTVQAINGTGYYQGWVVSTTSYLLGQNGFCIPVTIETTTTV